MPKPNVDFNTKTQQWEFKNRKGDIIFAVSEEGVNSLKIGAGSNRLDKLIKLTGTLPATNIGTQSTAIATITGMTGLAIGDVIVGVANKAALTDANLAIANPRIPTTNVLNVTLVNHRANTAGSTAAVGVDIIALRAT